MPKSTPSQTRAFSIRAQADSSAVRTETFMDREYTVVPVVALVEGVLQGMNAQTPELALQEEFGRVPEGWNGRPIVMNHPVINGQAVSANSPAVLETYQMGFVFNTVVEDGKLKVEAWLDNARIEEVGGEFASTLERINAGTTVEVSTGLFTGIEESKGRFNGKEYGGIWRDVVPDHLAFLSEGTIGACSIDDGCGTPRTNSTLKTHMSAITWEQQDCGCKHGGSDSMPKDNQQTPEGTEVAIKPNSAGVVPSFDSSRFALAINGKPADMVDQDARKLVAAALQSTKGRDTYTYVIGLTNDKVIYEHYSYDVGDYMTYQRSYNIADDKSVTLGNDEERVVVTMAITPVTASAAPKANEATEPTSTSTPETTPTGDPAMPDTPKDNAQTTQQADPADVNAVLANAGKPEATNVQTPTAVQTPAPASVATNAAPTAPRTLEQYLAEAPAEVKEVINAGLKLRNEKRASIIAAINSTNRSDFTEAQLAAMSDDVLESLAKLAAVPSYNGQNPGPTEITFDVNAGFAPPAPALIPPKSATA